jgi:hypothetical protein
MNKKLGKVLSWPMLPFIIMAGAVSLFAFLVDDAYTLHERKKERKEGEKHEQQ